MSSTFLTARYRYLQVLRPRHEAICFFFCQPLDCFCDEEKGAEVCSCFLEHLQNCFIIITADAPMMMAETIFSFAVKNILNPIRAV